MNIGANRAMMSLPASVLWEILLRLRFRWRKGRLPAKIFKTVILPDRIKFPSGKQEEIGFLTVSATGDDAFHGHLRFSMLFNLA